MLQIRMYNLVSLRKSNGTIEERSIESNEKGEVAFWN